MSRAQPLIDAALAANREAIAAGDRSFGPHHENAALFAMRGDRAAALDAFELAERVGFRDAVRPLRDPLLAALTSDPRFAAVMSRIQRDVQDMRARVDFSNLERMISGSWGAAASTAR